MQNLRVKLMIRIVNNTNSIHIRITNNQEVGIEEWRRIRHVFNTYFENNKKLLIVDVSDKARISPLIKRTFFTNQSNIKNIVVLIG